MAAKVVGADEEASFMADTLRALFFLMPWGFHITYAILIYRIIRHHYLSKGWIVVPESAFTEEDTNKQRG